LRRLRRGMHHRLRQLRGLRAMKIVLISKYPPIEGYVSSCTYWLARGLASRGHDITVITNSFEVEDSNREELREPDLDVYQGKRQRVRNTDPFQDYLLIPAANPFCEKLAAAAIEASEGADVLDAWYYISYGAAALLARAATGLPLVLRHAGSDIGRLAANPHLRPLISAMLRKADAVVATGASRSRLEELGARKGKVHVIPVSVDTGAFHPSASPARLDVPEGMPVISCIGKVSRGKGILQLLAAAAKVRGDFRLLFVSSDIDGLRGMSVHSGLRRKLMFKKFVPPWRMPGIIRASRAVVMPENGFPVAGHSPILPREVLACGTCAIISGELKEKVAGGALVGGENAVVVEPTDIEGFASKLSGVVRDEDAARRIGAHGHSLSARIEDFGCYLSANEKMYRDIIR
jgi:glycosyltransferase involved in cell wall biosynthesis